MKKLMILMFAFVSFHFAMAETEEGKTLWEMLVGSEVNQESQVTLSQQQVIANYQSSMEDVENVRVAMDGGKQVLDLVYVNQVYEWLETAINNMSSATSFDTNSYQGALDQLYTKRFNDLMDKYQVQRVERVSVSFAEETEESSFFMSHVFGSWKEELRNAGKELGHQAVSKVRSAVKRS